MKKDEMSYVQEKITLALLALLESHDIDELAVSDIVREAGVGRASFYRNFTTKRDVMTKHLQRLIQEWGKEFEATGDITKFSETLLKHYYKHKDVYLLLYRQNLAGMVFEQIRWATKIDKTENHIERYGKSTFAGLIFGAIDEWMRQGMQETPEQILILTADASGNGK